MKTYTINEMFHAIQGEGVRAGTVNLFLRFSGCNQACRVETHGLDCDTEFVSGRQLTAPEIVAELETIRQGCDWIVLTGGEPLLQVDPELCAALHEAGYKMAVETNGSVSVEGRTDEADFDWITVSPKVAEHAIRQKHADEVKYVRSYSQAMPQTVVQAEHYLISPAFNGMSTDPRALEWCTQLVKEDPTWRLSVQLHKGWQVR